MAKFPPLPEPVDLLQVMWCGDREFLRPVGDYVTTDQLRARDLEVWRMAMQEAAKACEFNAQRWLHSKGGYAAHECAAAIRALPEPGHE